MAHAQAPLGRPLPPSPGKPGRPLWHWLVLAAITALALAANTASAHYIAQYLSVGSTKYGKYQHIRQNTNDNSPVTCKPLTNLDLEISTRFV